MAYDIKGRLLESCTCNTLCPCWVGEDPDGGTCDGLFAWHCDEGVIEGVDVSGRTFSFVAHIPGNVLDGNWRIAVFIDDRCSKEQEDAFLNLWTGKLGGPVADFASLVGQVMGVEHAPVSFEVVEGKGVVKIGEDIGTELAPFIGATGNATTLHDTAFTSIPGSPAYPAKAAYYRVNLPKYDFDIDIRDHNAVEGSFHFQAA